MLVDPNRFPDDWALLNRIHLALELGEEDAIYDAAVELSAVGNRQLAVLLRHALEDRDTSLLIAILNCAPKRMTACPTRPAIGGTCDV